MRSFWFPLIATAALSGGCAPLIARTGVDLTCLQKREEIQAQLGEPATTGVADGHYFEEYRTRRRIAELYTHKAVCYKFYPMALAFTCGACELITVPCELYLVSRRALLGQTVRVTYDATGAIVGFARDGESLDPYKLSPAFRAAWEAPPTTVRQNPESGAAPAAVTAVPE